MLSRSPISTLLALALVLASGLSARASEPAGGAEAYERVVSRYASGDVQAARKLLDEHPPGALGMSETLMDVILAAAGSGPAARRLVTASRAASSGHPWLLLAAARGLSGEHPILATSLASTLLDRTPSGRAARAFMIQTMKRAGAPKLAARTLADGFGEPEHRLRGVSRSVLRQLPLRREPLYEAERGWMWLDVGEHDRAAAIFERALAGARTPGVARCWAMAGACRAALHSGRREGAWDLLLELSETCGEHPMGEEHDVWLARMAFGRSERATFQRALDRVAARGKERLRLHGLETLRALPGSRGGLLVLTRALRERYAGWPFRDSLVSVASQLWTNFDKRRKHELAIEMLQPILDAGYVAPRERARGELAYHLARSYRRAGQRALAETTLIHAAYHHPLNWYGILALEDLRELSPYSAHATEHTLVPAVHGQGEDPDWAESAETLALRDRLSALASYGLVEGVLAEARAARVDLHAGRAAWVGRRLLELGAPREASKLAHRALEKRGVRSPMEGHVELWRLAYPRPFRASVERHAGAHGVDPRLTWAIMRIESRYATRARSHAGASGLLQLMPSTAKWLAQLRGEPEPDDLYDPLLNIDLGSDLLGRLHQKFVGDVPLMLVAYNAGSGRTRRWQREVRANSIGRWVDRLPIAQAKNYVRSVVSAWALYRYLDGSSIGLAPDGEDKAVAQNL
ncbi:MAG: hypothetical protein CL940_05750 [Deltaproteobacteria bacterium]|nr:hypothetical protein [Deltaproteobacteria bacterium]